MAKKLVIKKKLAITYDGMCSIQHITYRPMWNQFIIDIDIEIPDVQFRYLLNQQRNENERSVIKYIGKFVIDKEVEVDGLTIKIKVIDKKDAKDAEE